MKILWFIPEALKSMWQIFFLFARLNLLNVLISVAKKCFPKASNFTSGGVQNRETKGRGLGAIVASIRDSKPREKQISPTFSYFLINNALLYHFLANWLAHNRKMTERSVFRGAWIPELTSQSFPVSCFWTKPPGGEIWRFWHITTRGRKIAIEKNFWLYLSAHLGDLVEQIKKVCHIHFK